MGIQGKTPGKGAAQSHSLLVRLTHGINFVSFCFLLASGIAILLAHPELYLGKTGVHGDEALISFPVPRIKWLSRPGRNYHFLFAWIFVINGLLYCAVSLVNRHFSRKLVPAGEAMRPANVLRIVQDHLRLQPSSHTEPGKYNLLQQLTYLSVIFVLSPLIILTGLTMSPAMTAAFPLLLDVFGGRQTARTLHFFVAVLLTLFTGIHLIQILLTGPVAHIRAITTGKSSDGTDHE